MKGLKFGESEFDLSLPRTMRVERIEPAARRPDGTAEKIIRRALERPIGSASLREMARGKRSAAILIPGKDRVAAAHIYIPLLLEELNAAGIPDERIEVFLATGTHAKHSAADAAALIGREAFGRVRWRQHACDDDRELKQIGVTSHGTEVLINRSVLDAGLKVLTGRIIPHYFAGWSGGRKTLIPGVAGFKTICQNHRLTLDPERGIHPRVRPYSLAGNPVHLDMLEGARLVEPVFLLNTLLDTNHRVISAFAGGLEPAHEAGCAEAEKLFKVEVDEPFDALITSAGGAPYDCNFMQALKAVFDVQEAVRPGGAILWVGQCPNGIKDGFLRWGRIGSDEELENAVRSDYNLTGHNSIMLRRLLRRARVALWSELPEEKVRTLGIKPIRSLQEGLDWLAGALRNDPRCGVVPFANVTCVSVLEKK